MIPGGPRRGGQGAPSGGAVAFVKKLYQDEFYWSMIKSATLFGFGIYVARELRGVDLIGSS